MAKFAVKTLEFDKVKSMLSSKAATFLGNEFAKVKTLQEETA